VTSHDLHVLRPDTAPLTPPPDRVEVWSEKGTVRGVLDPVLKEYGVGFRVMHGFGSATSVYDSILAQIEPEAWARCERAQQAEQGSLETLLDNWSALQDGAS
jgi:hypothetical protein